MPFRQESPTGNSRFSYAAPTAGTTQTIAGATALTADINKVAVGTANDGVALPSVPDSTYINTTVIVQNSNASNALKVYAANDGNSGTVDGGSAGAAATQAVSTCKAYVCTAANTWKSAQLS